MECVICTEKYNKSKHCKTECDYCNFQACNACWQTYFLNENIPKCMNKACEKEWTAHQMRRKFTQVFMNTKYKKHSEDVLYEKEKSLMPATQIIIENQIQIEKRIQAIENINVEINNLLSKKRHLESEIYRLRGRHAFENERKTFIRPCSKENCRGFLSTQWKCGLCETFTCHECHENKGKNRHGEDGQPHVCDPNNVSTAKLISSDSKPCPKCHANIFKIDGCDQMFCTMCHTAFSWRTGSIETNIHNPHYFEWLRQNNAAERNVLDVPCGRELTNADARRFRDIENHINVNEYIYGLIFNPTGAYTTFINNKHHITDMTSRKTKSIYVLSCYEVVRNVIHLNGVYVHELNVDNEDRKEKNRIDFMRNRITEDEFKKKLQIENKKERKKTELLRVHQLLRDVATEIVRRFMADLSEKHLININILDELPAIVEYVNQLLKDISDTYNSICYQFDEMCIRSNANAKCK